MIRRVADRIADFRSDTLTCPTPAMREAMATAVVGDDVFGEDPTVIALEREGAAFLGQEAALYVPSGTMANQCAIHVHCRPGDELICEERSHVFLYEGGGAARWSGTQVRALPSAPDADGFPSPAAIEAAVRRDDPHFPRSRLLVLENTHNMAGGTVLDRAGLEARITTARRHGLRVHVDGARLANAAIALGLPASALIAGVDSVSLCLSKGLGAPVGSLLAGSAAFVAEARRARKALGGGMRQAGVIAAAARLALRDGPAELERDHARARALADAFAELPGLRPRAPATNILMVDVAAPLRADRLVTALAERSVRALQVGPERLRFVTHRDLSDADVERCITAMRAAVGDTSS
ncbi:MAG: aminotransferase class I/II-fold pyridoxal phosphate-dependent enzyme [Planctomycetes bacterium]|nr:aminotransferase class I/II-fold pyridoxal phosphate-dependent enzyme [Planctomycetota bacterium]